MRVLINACFVLNYKGVQESAYFPTDLDLDLPKFNHLVPFGQD